MPEPQWKLKVEQLMACNCNWGCPCSFNAPPTYGKCETALAYRIAKGSYGGVTLDGLKFILVAAWPKAIHLGHGRGVLFLDARATGPKREALEAIATAKAGGPNGADRIPVHRQTEPVPHRGPCPRGIRTDAKPRDRRGPLPDRPAPDGIVHEERGVLLGQEFPRRGERVRIQLSRTKRDPRRLDVAGPHAREVTRLRPVATARDSGFELSTRLHCTYVIVPLPRGLPDDEPSRERGEQPVGARQVDVERHFEPSAFRFGEQPIRVVRVPHVRAGIGFPAVRRPQVYKKPRD